MRARVLPSSRGWRESDAWDQYPPLVGRVPVVGQQDPATDLVGAPVDSQVSSVHVHHEHGQHPGHGDHNQLELQGAEDPQNAPIDQKDIPQVSAHYTDDEEAQEDASQVDDGDSERDVAHFHLLGQPDRVAQTSAHLVDEIQDGGDGVVGSSSSELQDQQEGSSHDEQLERGRRGRPSR